MGLASCSACGAAEQDGGAAGAPTSCKAPPSEKESLTTYGSVGTLEAVDLLLGGVELVLRNEGLEDFSYIVPELLVVVVEQDDKAGGLRVEGGGDMEDGLLDKLLDLGV